MKSIFKVAIIFCLILLNNFKIMEQNKNKGFTLIELLVVLAIIGILASVILVRLTDARARGQEASAKTSSKTVLSLLVECKNDEGEAPIANINNDGTTLICCEDNSCADAKEGYETQFWPDITKLGYSYTYVSGTVVDGDYTFQLEKTGQETVSCTMTRNNCE